MTMFVFHDSEGNISSITVATAGTEAFGGEVHLERQEWGDEDRLIARVDTEDVQEIHRALSSGLGSEEMQRAIEMTQQNYRISKGRITRK